MNNARLLLLLNVVWFLFVPTFANAENSYLGPVDVVTSADGQLLYVVEADAASIAVVETATGEVKREFDLPARPNGAAVATDGRHLYVPCGGPQGVVSVIDTATGDSQATIPVGHTPCAPSLSPDGERLFVCNRFNHDVSVVDLSRQQQVARVAAIREPVASVLIPDGTRLFVANLLPDDPADSQDVAAEISVVDTVRLTSSSIRLPNGSSSVNGLCVSPDGRYVYAVHLLSRYQSPTTQLERGWINTNALSVLDVEDQTWINTVLLDDVDLGSANPWGVTVTADGSQIVVSHAGTHELSVIDATAMHEKLAGLPKTMAEARGARGDVYSTKTADDVQNDLAFLVGMRRKISLRRNARFPAEGESERLVNGPRGLVEVGSKIYVAVYFSDMLAVVDLDDESLHPVRLIPLGPEPALTAIRRGEMFFHDGDFCFQHWLSCASCHPDARVDALNWDLLNDGIGNPKNAKSMLLAHRTPPAMSTGIRDDAETAVRAGIRHIQFSVRPKEDAEAIDEYLKSLTPVPSPYLVDGQLSEGAKRGKVLFFSERVNCAKCHPEPLYTDLKMHNVLSRGLYDRRAEFDTPTLIEVWRTAPYLHDGQYRTIRELLLDGKHGEGSGEVEDLSAEEAADLAEFVLSL